ncbi:MAG: recombinase family protein [Candidatus Thorarchaeota archaeon]
MTTEGGFEEGKRIAIYARVSTEEQASKGHSLEAQVEALKKFCDDNGLRYCRVYKDNGQSGTNLDRPMLQKMLDHAFQGLFDGILVWKVDRLSRRMKDLLELVDYLKSCDVTVKSSTEPIDPSTPMGECVFNMMGNFAQMEQRMLVERVKLGLRRRWEQGKWKGGVPPYGYDYNLETERLEVNEEEAKVVRMMFKHYLRVKSIRMVTNYLNRKGILTRSGGTWIDSTAGIILSRQTYNGVLKIGDVINELPELRIITKRTFEKAQGLREKRKRLGPRVKPKQPLLVNGSNCHNCRTALLGEMRYCPQCGARQMELGVMRKSIDNSSNEEGFESESVITEV